MSVHVVTLFQLTAAPFHFFLTKDLVVQLVHPHEDVRYKPDRKYVRF